MRRALLLAAASAVVLSACQPAAEDVATPDVAAESAADVAELAADASAPAASRATTVGGATGDANTTAVEPLAVQPPQPPAPIARIAYAYRYILSIPKDRGAELMSRHELACASAGPGYCQVVSARADWAGRNPGGVLELRGQPQWIDRFRANMALDAQNVGGKLEEAITEGEDVTRGIEESSAGVKTSETLTQRIEALQRQRGGTMEQRLQIEQQLAALMRQRDEQAAELRALETRVQTARLTLDYRQGGLFAADNPSRPVAQALQNAFGLSMGMIAALITLGSVLLPIAVIGGVVWWGVVRKRRKPAAA